MNLFLFPSINLVRFLEGWLKPKEVCRLDSSLCNRRFRETFMRVVSSNTFAINYNKWFGECCVIEYLKWLSIRQISIRQLQFTKLSSVNTPQIKFMNIRKVLQNVKEICCMLALLDDEFMEEVLPLCPNLQSFTLNYAPVGENTLAILANHGQQLRKLDIGGLKNRFTIAPVLESCPHLETLNMEEHALSSDEEAALLQHCRNLKSFRYSHWAKDAPPFNPYVAAALCSHCPMLEDLSINDSGAGVTAQSVDVLMMVIAQTLPHIRYLDCCWSVRSGPGLNSVFFSCASLQILEIYNCEGVTSAALLHLLSHCRQLRSVDLCRNMCVTGEAPLVNSDTAGGNALQLLQLAKFTALTDSGLNNLLTFSAKLCNLVIENSPRITVLVLGAVHRHCQRMKRIYFTGCAQIKQKLVNAKLRSLGMTVEVIVYEGEMGCYCFAYDDEE